MTYSIKNVVWAKVRWEVNAKDNTNVKSKLIKKLLDLMSSQKEYGIAASKNKVFFVWRWNISSSKKVDKIKEKFPSTKIWRLKSTKMIIEKKNIFWSFTNCLTLFFVVQIEKRYWKMKIWDRNYSDNLFFSYNSL